MNKPIAILPSVYLSLVKMAGLGLVQHDLTGRLSNQMGLPFGNSTGVAPPIPSSGPQLGSMAGSFTSRDDGISNMGFKTQETIGMSYRLVFDIQQSAKLGTGPEKFSRGQLLFLTRETEFERRPQYVFFGHTLSTLNRVLSSGAGDGAAGQNFYRTTMVQDNKEANIRVDYTTAVLPQSIFNRFNFMGVMDVVKPNGVNSYGILDRENVAQLSVNCVLGGRVPQCFNYWAVRPPGCTDRGSNVSMKAIREHLYLWLMLRPVFEWRPSGIGNAGSYRYWWQYSPVCTFYNTAPSYADIFHYDPKFAELTDKSVCIPVGRSHFIDHKEARVDSEVLKLTYPYLNNNVIDVSVSGNFPQFTVIVDHQSGH